jgi:hypothetical protein
MGSLKISLSRLSFCFSFSCLSFCLRPVVTVWVAVTAAEHVLVDLREPVAVAVADPVSDLLSVVDNVDVFDGISIVAAVYDEDLVAVLVNVCVQKT